MNIVIIEEDAICLCALKNDIEIVKKILKINIHLVLMCVIF